MGAAIISVSKDGRDLSKKLAQALKPPFNEVKRFVFEKYADEGSEKFSDIKELTMRLFGEFDALIFVCACGIAVRAIAPHIKSKTTDPAVVVVDDSGKFAIPILSGHIGGANSLARIIAVYIGAEPVITTATDIRGKFSPDLFAKANNLILDDLQAAKEVAAAVLRGDSVAVTGAFPMINIPRDVFRLEICSVGIDIVQKPNLKDLNRFSGLEGWKRFPPINLDLLARNIVLGIGCKRGVPADIIEKRVFAAFEYMKYDFRQVVEIATINLKRDEQGLLEFAERHKLPIKFFTAEELMSVPEEPHNLKGSDFVLKITGADNVSERAAILAADGGRILIPKSYPNCTGDGVTVAAAAKPIVIDFAKEQP